jgi:hypothetical protein
MASSSADCVFGRRAIDFVGQQEIREDGTATSRNSCVRRSNTLVPVMSAGIRSGVNWMRWNSPATARARAFTSSVFPTPGTPSISAWPPASSVTSARSMASFCPTITRPSASRTRRAPLVIVADAEAACASALADSAARLNPYRFFVHAIRPSSGILFGCAVEPSGLTRSEWAGPLADARCSLTSRLSSRYPARGGSASAAWSRGPQLGSREMAWASCGDRRRYCSQHSATTWLAGMLRSSRRRAATPAPSPWAHDLPSLVTPRAPHQIAAHAPKQGQQSHPEKHQRNLQPVSPDQPKHSLILAQSVQRLIHPNHRTSARDKIKQHRVRMRLDRFVQQERLLARGD